MQNPRHVHELLMAFPTKSEDEKNSLRNLYFHLTEKQDAEQVIKKVMWSLIWDQQTEIAGFYPSHLSREGVKSVVTSLQFAFAAESYLLPQAVDNALTLTREDSLEDLRGFNTVIVSSLLEHYNALPTGLFEHKKQLPEYLKVWITARYFKKSLVEEKEASQLSSALKIFVINAFKNARETEFVGPWELLMSLMAECKKIFFSSEFYLLEKEGRSGANLEYVLIQGLCIKLFTVVSLRDQLNMINYGFQCDTPSVLKKA